jgi:chromosome partitioning protein
MSGKAHTMKVVALGQGKGGVGKSTTAIHLACAATVAGQSAIIIDLDADQGTALKWAARRMGAMPPVGQANAVTLPDILKQLKATKIQWVILDLPGRAGPVSSAGLRAADMVLVPCRPHDIDLEASFSTVQAIQGAGVRYAYLMAITPTTGTARTAAYAKALTTAGHRVCPVSIGQRMDVPDAVATGKSVFETDPKGKAAAEFRELFKWLKKEA